MNDTYIYGKLNNSLERAKPISKTIEIKPSDWENNSYSVEIEGVLANSLVVAFYPTLGTIQSTEDNMFVYSDMGIYCTSIANGKIVFERKKQVDEIVFVGVWIWL